MRIVLVSLNQFWEDKNKNYLACRTIVKQAKDQGRS